MREHEIPVCSGPGQLPDVIVSGGLPITNYTLPAGATSDLSWNTPRQKVLIHNETGADVLVLIGEVGCTVGNRSIRLADGDPPLVIGAARPHLLECVSVRPDVEAVIHSATGTKTLTVLGWPLVG